MVQERVVVAAKLPQQQIWQQSIRQVQTPLQSATSQVQMQEMLVLQRQALLSDLCSGVGGRSTRGSGCGEGALALHQCPTRHLSRHAEHSIGIADQEDTNVGEAEDHLGMKQWGVRVEEQQQGLEKNHLLFAGRCSHLLELVPVRS